MRRLSLLCFWLLLATGAATPAHAQPHGQRFVSIALHDIADSGGLTADTMRASVLVEFFDWLKGAGWTAVSLDDVAAAARGARPLPDRAILITVDDGFRSLYTRIFPLLRVYGYPVLAAVVGSWMADTPDGTVPYGDRRVPRSNFISWAEAREMQASGLVEFASHSDDLHRGMLANPQGNFVPSAVARRYDPTSGRYEDDAAYRARIHDDLAHARTVMATELGRAP